MNGRDSRSPVGLRLYDLLLRLYPADHRRAFGQQMRQSFRDQYRDVLAQEGRAGAGFWLDVFGDQVWSIAREHLAALEARVNPMSRNILDIGLAMASAVAIIVSTFVLRPAPQDITPRTVAVLLALGLDGYLAIRHADSLRRVAGEALNVLKGRERRFFQALFVTALVVSSMCVSVQFFSEDDLVNAIGSQVLIPASLIMFGLAGYVTSRKTRRLSTGALGGVLAGSVSVGLTMLAFIIMMQAESYPPGLLPMMVFALQLVLLGALLGALCGILGAGIGRLARARVSWI